MVENIPKSTMRYNSIVYQIPTLLQNEQLDLTSGVINYTDFINKELLAFSHYDTVRSIPSLVDGLKPSQRKVCPMYHL